MRVCVCVWVRTKLGDELTVAGKVRGAGWICIRLPRKPENFPSLGLKTNFTAGVSSTELLLSPNSLNSHSLWPHLSSGGHFSCFCDVGVEKRALSFCALCGTHVQAQICRSYLMFSLLCQVPACSLIWTRTNMLPFSGIFLMCPFFCGNRCHDKTYFWLRISWGKRKRKKQSSPKTKQC